MKPSSLHEILIIRDEIIFMQKNVNKIHNSCINIKNMQIRLYIRKKVAIIKNIHKMHADAIGGSI